MISKITSVSVFLGYTINHYVKMKSKSHRYGINRPRSIVNVKSISL